MTVVGLKKKKFRARYRPMKAVKIDFQKSGKRIPGSIENPIITLKPHARPTIFVLILSSFLRPEIQTY